MKRSSLQNSEYQHLLLLGETFWTKFAQSFSNLDHFFIVKNCNFTKKIMGITLSKLDSFRAIEKVF
jgi:hypothetical protein